MAAQRSTASEPFQSISRGQTSLSNIAVAKGTFEPGQVPSLALRPFFAEIFKKCGTTIPVHIEDAIRGNRKF
jgi:hypothetical protein